MGKDVTVVAVVGAQYGSEGKGVIVNHLADQFNVHVRVGGPNAGHTFLHRGVEYKMRAIPCGWTNPVATLVIGRGAIVNPKVLKEEIEMVQAVDPTIVDRLFVDSGAWCVTLEDVMDESTIGLKESIGSTLEGVGAARIRRIARSPKMDNRFGPMADEWGLGHYVHDDTAMLLNWFAESKRTILLEGTQGFGLSLLHGTWPYVTSADTTASQLAADCGLGPSKIDDVLLVMRYMPIRVGGNSGPMKKEIDWDALSSRLGRNVKEYTTVTRRLRRIAEWDDEIITQARILNGARYAALTFADYLDPRVEGKRELTRMMEKIIEQMEIRHHLSICLVGTGGPHLTVINRRKLPWEDA